MICNRRCGRREYIRIATQCGGERVDVRVGAVVCCARLFVWADVVAMVGGEVECSEMRCRLDRFVVEVYEDDHLCKNACSMRLIAAAATSRLSVDKLGSI